MKIVVLGSGNVATQLTKAFAKHGHKIIQVYSKTSANAKVLADAVSATAIANTSQIDTTADLYLIAVSDAAIGQLVLDMPVTDHGIVIHTSGATPLDVLSKFKNHGVIYPPQSISKEIDLDIQAIPFGIEANTEKSLAQLFSMLRPLAPKTFACNTKQRLALHIAAVFANNFPNALFQMANELLEHEQLNFDLIRPIILETAKKVQTHLPSAVQTGPASRNDNNTINTHLQFLSYSNELSQIYQYMTEFIIKSRQK